MTHDGGEPMPLWDVHAGREARDEALDNVQVRSVAWRTVARDALLAVIARGVERITSEDVWRELQASGIGKPDEPRAMGPVMQRAVADGLLIPTPEFVQATAVTRHAAPIRAYEVVGVARPSVWRSAWDPEA